MQLSTISLALTRLGGAAFSPSSLFTGGVQGAWYDPSDLTTLFQDSAGTTPVTAVEQPVGLMLDKSKGLVLGSELVTAPYSGAVSGGFSITSTSVVRDGVTPGGTASLTLSTTLTANAFYQVTFTAAGLSGDNTVIRVGSTATGNFYRITTAGTYTIYLPAGGTAAILGIAPFAGTAGGITLTNISVRALPGNHAYQTTSASRPTLRARYNLLTYSEEPNNAFWNPIGASLTLNSTTSPINTSNGCTITESALNERHLVGMTNLTVVAANTNVTALRYIKQKERRYAQLALINGAADSASILVDLQTGLVTDTRQQGNCTYVSSSCVRTSDGWCAVTLTARTSASTGFFLNTCISNADNFASTTLAFQSVSYQGDGTSGIYIWGAQLTQNAVFPSNTYQRIGAATDYATGAAFPPYLAFDGVDDSLLTNSVDFSATNKMLVVAGVHRNSGAGTSFPVEFSSSDANNGSFGIGADSAGAEYFFNSRGTTLRQVSIDNAAYNAPVTNVLTLTSDIAAPSLVARINAVQVGTNTSSQGTGNFGNYPLFIGSRNNSTYFLNGNIYSLIIAGQSYSSGQISSTESWVAAKTPLGTI